MTKHNIDEVKFETVVFKNWNPVILGFSSFLKSVVAIMIHQVWRFEFHPLVIPWRLYPQSLHRVTSPRSSRCHVGWLCHCILEMHWCHYFWPCHNRSDILIPCKVDVFYVLLLATVTVKPDEKNNGKHSCCSYRYWNADNWWMGAEIGMKRN